MISLRVGIHQNLHKALRFALFDGAPDFGHRTLSDQHLPAAGLAELPAASRSSRPAPAADRCTTRRSVMRSLTLRGSLIQQIRRDDLEIVIGRVRERALAVAISHRPDAGNVGAKLIVDLDVAAGIHGDAGLLESQIVGIGAPPDREQDDASREFQSSCRPSPRWRSISSPCRAKLLHFVPRRT